MWLPFASIIWEILERNREQLLFTSSGSRLQNARRMAAFRELTLGCEVTLDSLNDAKSSHIEWFSSVDNNERINKSNNFVSSLFAFQNSELKKNYVSPNLAARPCTHKCLNICWEHLRISEIDLRPTMNSWMPHFMKLWEMLR